MDEWDRLKPSDELLKEIGMALRLQKESEEWKRGIGIPYAVRYLRRRRWEEAETYSLPTVPPHENDRPSIEASVEIFGEGEGFWMGGGG